MKTERNILTAFILNAVFSAFELFGGIFTGSTAIISDAMHDAGDAVSIGISYFLEKKSKKQPDKTHTYGYARYSLMGGAITSLILLISSLAVIVNAVKKIINPTEINSDGMMIFSFIGIAVNLTAVIITHKGESLNSKAVNLHMLEDVLGWFSVLICAVIIKLTDFVYIDPIISVCVSTFILINAAKNLKSVSDIFLEKTPDGINTDELRNHLCKIDGVIDVHHIHVWSIDGTDRCATMHISAKNNPAAVKPKIRNELNKYGIYHATIEFETENEHCCEKHCSTDFKSLSHHH